MTTIHAYHAGNTMNNGFYVIIIEKTTILEFSRIILFNGYCFNGIAASYHRKGSSFLIVLHFT